MKPEDKEFAEKEAIRIVASVLFEYQPYSCTDEQIEKAYNKAHSIIEKLMKVRDEKNNENEAKDVPI